MRHIHNTRPDVETDSDDLPDDMDDLPSELIVIFRLSALPGWVYIAMTGDNDAGLIKILIKDCPVVVREDMATTRWDDDGIVLSMGTSFPIFYRVLGHEFQQTLLSLAHPPTFHSRPDQFTVGKWICIGRPGIYWGDMGFVRSLSDPEEEERLIILLVPRITDEENLAVYIREHVRPPLRKELWPHTSDDPPLSTEGKEGTWMFGRDTMTEDGMVLRSFAPWELRKDMVDGSALYLLPEQDTHFRHHLEPEYWPHMPPMCDPCLHFLRGERVQVAGHSGIIAGYDKSVGAEHDAFPLPSCKFIRSLGKGTSIVTLHTLLSNIHSWT
jgi:hypothetical protein